MQNAELAVTPSAAPTVYALNQNWLNTETVASFNGVSTSTNYQDCNNAIGYYQTGYWYPWVYPITTAYCWPARPIKLTLSEVERLRKVAKADAKVKAILAKFTDLIEITVDFE